MLGRWINLKLLLSVCLTVSAVATICPSECHRAQASVAHDCCASHAGECRIAAAPQWACTCLHAAPVLASFTSASSDVKHGVFALVTLPLAHRRIIPTAVQRPARSVQHAPPARPFYLTEQQFLI